MVIRNKDDIEFFTEFPCFLGHPVVQSIFVKCDDCQLSISDVIYRGLRVSIAIKTTFTYIGAHPEYLTLYATLTCTVYTAELYQ